MWRVIWWVVLLAACGSNSGPPVDPAPAPEPEPGSGSAVVDAAPVAKADDEVLALDPSVRHGVLANGLTYYVMANDKPKNRVQLWLAVDAGSVLETDAQRGLAHMVEHLAFAGTKRFPKHDIQDFIERSGMKFGADLNATTSFDETVYELVVPSDGVDRGLDVLRDWTADITFDPQAVVDERKIIEEERRFRNDVAFRLASQVIPVRLSGTRYAGRLPIGTTEVIEGATADQLAAFYKAWYRPDREAVIVVGDVDAAAIEKAVKDKFGTVPSAPPTAPRRPVTTVETSHPPRFVVARDKENTLYVVAVSYQFPHRSDATAGDYRRRLVETLFARLLDERLDTIAKRGTAGWTDGKSELEPEVRSVDTLTLRATVKDAHVREALGDLVAELARIRQHGFGDAELVQGKGAILQSLASKDGTHDSRALATGLLSNFLAHDADPGATKERVLARRYLPEISNAELVELAKSIGDGRVVIVIAPLAGEVPTEQELRDTIAAADRRDMPAWKAADLTQPLIAEEPTPGKVIAEKPLAAGVTQWTLSNGARVYLKPTTFKREEVSILAVSTGGTSVVSDKDYPQVRFASDIVNLSGVGTYSVQELKKKLPGENLTIEAKIKEDEERITATGANQRLETLAQIVYAGFTAPRRDDGAFATWRAQQLQLIDFVAANAQARFLKDSFDYLFDKHPRIPLFPSRAEIEAVTLDGALAQYRARFANAADFSFVIVGAFEPAKVRPFVEKYFASLPATKDREVARDVGLRPRKGTVAQTFRAGSEAKSMSILLSWAEAPWSLQLESDADILKRVLDLEMTELLRVKLGGTYAVKARTEASRTPPPATLLFATFESSPENAKLMQDEAWKALDKLATSPISDDTLAKVREQIVKEHEAELRDNAYWSKQLERVGRYGDDLATLLDISRVTARVTKEQVQRTARQLVDKTNRATFTLLPEK